MSTPVKTSSLSLKEQQLIRSLIQKGYCVVSRKHGHIARIDRPDWRECMAAIHSPWDPEGEGMQWASSCNCGEDLDLWEPRYLIQTKK